MLNNLSKSHAGRLMTTLVVAMITGVLLLSLTGFVRAEVDALALSVEMTSSGDAVAGGTMDYRIVVTTSGTGAASFQITDTLPVSLTYVADSLSVSPSGWTVTENGGVISSDARVLNPGDTAEVTFKAKIDDNAIVGDSIDNTVNLVGQELFDSIALSDSSTDSITIVEQTDPVDLFVSKTASRDESSPGDTLNYTIKITTSADALRSFVLTDTLPAGVTFVDGSLNSSAGFVVSEDSGVISSNVYGLNPGLSVQTSFTVMIDESTPISTVITNTVMMHDMVNDLMLEASAGTTVVSQTGRIAYMPFMALPHTSPTINAITAPTGNENEWTVSWSDVHSADTRITGYEVQESTSPDFTENLSTTTLGKVTSLDVTKELESQIFYYYRVRALSTSDLNDKSVWSGIAEVLTTFFYEELFEEPADANADKWRIARQDTDEIINKLTIHDGYLDMRMESRFDYMIASDLTVLPEPPFRIKALMRLEDADPRHAGGIILGGDYDGTSACPESVDAENPENSKYTTCFNEYYRFMFIAGNVSNQFTTQVKRIDEHSETNNSGSGFELASKTFISDKGRKNWIEWSVEVYQDGTMKLFLAGEEIHVVNDTTYQDNKYFGFWSSTSDTSFSNTQIDWVTIEPIN